MNTKYTLEYIKDIISSYRNGEFEFVNVESFDGCKSKVTVKHTKCGRVLSNQNIANFIGLDRGCKFCDSNRMDPLKIKHLIELDPEYICDEEPINLKTKIKIKHLACNNIFEMRPADFIYNKHRCLKCSGRNFYDSESLKYIIPKIDGDYEFIELKHDPTKRPSRQKILIKHTSCGSVSECIIHNFVNNGQRCRECSKSSLKYISNSKGSMLIEKFLLDNNIIFEREKKFEGLKYKRSLRFDFFINLDGREILIEFDGKQHFETNKSNKIFTNELIKKTKERDKIKNDFCKKNNKELIRFSYKQTSDEILSKLKILFSKEI